MGFSISISGDASQSEQAEGAEQSLIDDLVATIAKHSDKLNYATGTFDFQGTVDLLAAAQTSSGGGTPPPSGFQTKMAGESYADYQARLFTYNAHTPVAEQAPSLSEADWDALPVG